MMGVDHEGFDSDAEKMIEDESDQRFLKNRNERLRQLLSQRTEARAQASGENEGLRDHHSINPPRLCSVAGLLELAAWRKKPSGVGRRRSSKTSGSSFWPDF